MRSSICAGVKVRPASRANLVQYAGAVEMAEVVVAAIAPVEALEGVAVEAGEGDEALVGGAVLGAEDFTVVEDDGADH